MVTLNRPAQKDNLRTKLILDAYKEKYSFCNELNFNPLGYLKDRCEFEGSDPRNRSHK